jgi:hypothetical protein
VLVLTRDLIPRPGRPVSGGGLRAWGLGEGLRARGHEVIYSMPRALVSEGDPDELRRSAFDGYDLHGAVLRAEPDLLLLEQWGLATYLPEVSLPVVLDLHGSLILENAFREHRSLASNAAAKIKALQKADLVLCPAERQRAYFASWMMMAGADPLEIPIEVIPVSMSPELPERGAPTDGPLAVVYGGQTWPWIDSSVALRAATEVLQASGAGVLHLFVQEPQHADVLPHDDSTHVAFRALPDDVLRSPAARIEGQVAHHDLVARYARAHLALDLYARNSERHLAYTTRTIEYLWCGLPVVYGDYGELAPLIERHEAGWIVDPADGAAVRRVLEQALGDRRELERRGANAQRLVRERLTWDRTIEPLDRFVRDPRVRAKGTTIFGKLALEFDRLGNEAQQRIEALQDETRRLAAEVGQSAAERQRVATLILELQTQLGALERKERNVSERLRAEQQDHAQTAARYERAAAAAAVAERQLAERQRDLDQQRTDLKNAVSQLDRQTRESEAQVERVTAQLRETAERELALRKDLAESAVQLAQSEAQIAAGRQERERLTDEASALRREVQQHLDEPLPRAVSTGRHVWRRVHQVPALAGLLVRNLANNVYMTMWERRHSVRIFPRSEGERPNKE